MHKRLSVIVPCRNEEVLLPQTLDSILNSIAIYSPAFATDICLSASDVEVIVVDNASSDGSSAIIDLYQHRYDVRTVLCPVVGIAAARNAGAAAANGHVLLFIDADTLVPGNTIQRVLAHVVDHHKKAGMCAIRSREKSLRATVWWHFWNTVRALPLPRAKAMGACMFCTKDTFNRYGPFPETVALTEEWAILANVFRYEKNHFVYDRRLHVQTSARRMALQHFGYVRTFIKYCFAVLSPLGRVSYVDTLRHLRN